MTVRTRFLPSTPIFSSMPSIGARVTDMSSRRVSWPTPRNVIGVLTLPNRSPSFFTRRRERNLLPASVARAFVHDWLEVFEITSADASALADAIEAVQEHKIAFWDAMIWATARRTGCAAVISEDMQDGRLLGGVEFINPFAENAQDRPSSVPIGSLNRLDQPALALTEDYVKP